MTEYKETEVEPGDHRTGIFEVLSEGSPFVFVVCHIDPDGSLDLKVETGGGVSDAATVRSLLEKTLAALP